MSIEVGLILITLAVAVVGTIWRDPPNAWKVGLIVLALVASAFSIAKAQE
jgi:hypothetical protein